MQLSKVLLAVDLNGVLCHREEAPVPGVQEDCYLPKRAKPYYYKREGIENFLRTLREVGFEVVIYSAIREYNIAPVCKQFFAKYGDLSNLRIYHQAHCKKDPIHKDRFIRHLPFVWRYENHYDAKTTILMDNEEHKFAEWSANGIVVPEYSLEHVVNKEKDTLKVFEEYLVEMAKHFGEKGFDVREYMKVNRRPRIVDHGEEDEGVLVEGLKSLEVSEYEENVEKYGKLSVSFSEIIQKDGKMVIKYSTPTGSNIKFIISDLNGFGEAKYLVLKMQIAAMANLLYKKCKIEFDMKEDPPSIPQEIPTKTPAAPITVSKEPPAQPNVSPAPSSVLLNKEEVLEKYGSFSLVFQNIYIRNSEVLVNFGNYKYPIRMEVSLDLSKDEILLSNEIKLNNMPKEGLKVKFYSK